MPALALEYTLDVRGLRDVPLPDNEYSDHHVILTFFNTTFDRLEGQISHLKYLGNMDSCTNELDINYKLNNFIKMTGIINNILTKI